MKTIKHIYKWKSTLTKLNMSDKILSDNCNRAVEQHKIDDYYTGYLSMSMIMLILSPVTVILNAVTIYVFLKGKRMKSITDILLCFLAITDIIGGFLAMPSFAVESMLRSMEIRSPCSIFLMRKVVGFFPGSITVFTSVLIVLDRYFSIFQPFRYDARKNQIGLAISLTISSWFICFVICLISIITWNYHPVVYFVNVADACFLVLSLWIHFKIFSRARRTQREIAIESGQFERNDTKIKSWSRIKGVRLTVIMFLGIILCYAPHIVTRNLMRKLHYSRSSLIAYFWTTGLVLINSVVAPMIYIWQMKWFRNALWKIMSEGKLSIAQSTIAPGYRNWMTVYDKAIKCDIDLLSVRWKQWMYG